MTGEFNPYTLTPKITAATELIGRTGARSVDFRLVGTGDTGDEPPIGWLIVATYESETETRHEAAGAMDPETAILRLCEHLIDGGLCTHCAKLTAFDPVGSDDTLNNVMAPGVCWTMWDPELKTFRRGCEGDDHLA